jgi:molybdopterin synthase catalytic subunit
MSGSRFLTREPILLDPLVAAVQAEASGAIATFLGVVRDHHEGRAVADLAYEAYEPMAEAECARIVEEARARWPCRIALQHRTGPLAVGETAVAIAVSAAHREGAFAACRYVIEELKRRVPIWKRERYRDGTEAWVDPTAPGGIVPALPGKDRS